MIELTLRSMLSKSRQIRVSQNCFFNDLEQTLYEQDNSIPEQCFIFGGKFLSNKSFLPELLKKNSGVGSIRYGVGKSSSQHVYFLNSPNNHIYLELPEKDMEISFLHGFFDFMMVRFKENLEISLGDVTHVTGEIICRLTCDDDLIAERSSTTGILFHRKLDDFFPRKENWCFGIYFTKPTRIVEFGIVNGNFIYHVDKIAVQEPRSGFYLLSNSNIKYYGESKDLYSLKQGVNVRGSCSKNCATDIQIFGLTFNSKRINSEKGNIMNLNNYKEVRESIEQTKSREVLLTCKTLELFSSKTQSREVDECICKFCKSPLNMYTLEFLDCYWKISSVIVDPYSGNQKKVEIGWNKGKLNEHDERVTFNLKEFLESHNVSRIQVETRYFIAGKNEHIYYPGDEESRRHIHPEQTYCMYCLIPSGKFEKSEVCEHYSHKKCFQNWKGFCFKCQMKKSSGIITNKEESDDLNERISYFLANNLDEESLKLKVSCKNCNFEFFKSFFLL